MSALRFLSVTVAVWLSGSILAVAQWDWVVENASGLKWFEGMKPRHLAVNATGHPCIAFGGDHLYYAERDSGGSWHVSTVDDKRDVGRYASLALRSGRYPRIAYLGASNKLGYAEWVFQDGQWQWNLETPDPDGYNGSYASIAVGNDGYAQIAYHKYNAGLQYVRQTGSGWTTPEAVDPDPVNAPTLYYSIAVDANNYPHILSMPSGSGHLYYSYKDSSGWHRSTVANSPFHTTPCIRIRGGFVHAAFFEPAVNGGQYRLRYVSFGAGNPAIWLEDETVVTVSLAAGASLSLDTLATSQPHVAYTVPGSTYVYHYVRTGPDAWSGHALLASDPTSVSIALNASAEPFLSHRDQGGGIELMCRQKTGGGSWSAATTVAHGSDPGPQQCDLAFLGDGTPVVAYRDEMLKRMVMREHSALWGWLTYDQDVNGNCGGWVSIAEAMEHPRQLHAAYRVQTGADLRYQKSQGTPIVGPTLIDSAGDVGTHVSLAIHPVSGRPAIAYRDETNQKLKFASQVYLGGNWAWFPTVLDSATGTGEYTAFEYDSAGHPYVAYRRADAVKEVRVVSNLGSGWSAPEVVLTYGGLDPEHVSITFDTNDAPHLSVIDAASGQLLHGVKTPSGWDWRAIPGVTDATGMTSIMIDGGGQPNILFVGQSTVRVAKRQANGTSWDFDNIYHLLGLSAENSRAGRLLRGPNGRPAACFYDAVEKDIMFAWKPVPQITSITPSGSGQYQLQWTGEWLATWIDGSPTMETGSWTEIAGPVTGYGTSISEPASKMYYRLRLR